MIKRHNYFAASTRGLFGDMKVRQMNFTNWNFSKAFILVAKRNC